MLKKLAPYIGEFKKEAILSPVCIAIEVIMEVILPMLMAQVIDFFARVVYNKCDIRANARNLKEN